MPGVPQISPEDAWAAIREQPDAVLVDVRTDAEWNFVGVPDISVAGKQVVLIAWQLYPAMSVNGQFAQMLSQAGIDHGQPVYFICRSGARSDLAARAAQDAGWVQAFNVADGFEGPVDAQGHRGTLAGWKAAGLPWMQR